MTITYTKLKSGDWGIKVVGNVSHDVTGCDCKVTKKDGTVKIERATKRLWSDADAAIYAIEATSKSTSGNSGSFRPSGRSNGGMRDRRTGCSCGIVEGRTKPTDCWSCKHDAD